jgi:outer membrane protein W
VQATTAYIPELDLSYFLSPNLSLEAIAGTSRHEVSAHDSALGGSRDRDAKSAAKQAVEISR